MSNPTPVVTPGMSYTDFLTAASDVLQVKYDRRGSEVDPADTTVRGGAVYVNTLDDIVMALWQRNTRLGSTTAATVTGSAASGGGTVNFEITLQSPLTLYTVHWLRVVSDANSVGGTVQFYADSGRTKLVYQRDIVDGSGAAADETYDGTPWSAIASDGTQLADSKLYGTITNNGGSNSTYSVYHLTQSL